MMANIKKKKCHHQGKDLNGHVTAIVNRLKKFVLLAVLIIPRFGQLKLQAINCQLPDRS